MPALRLAGLGHRAGRPRAARGASAEADGARRARPGMAAPLQMLEVKGDWAGQRPDVRPGGWAFQYGNDYYPELDDTAVVAMAMDRRDGHGARRRRYRRGREWIEGCRAGTAAGAPSTPTTAIYLNNIPFADHGALLDPPTEDVTARCVGCSPSLATPGRSAPAAAQRYLDPTSRRTEPGAAAGASITSMAPGRRSAG